MSSSTPNAWPKPFVPRLAARWSYRLHAVVAGSRGFRWLARALERVPRAYRGFTALERATKERLYGCRMCAQCALPVTGYACPKQLRNGPCGGVSPTGACEAHPKTRCVWLVAYEQAQGSGHGRDDELWGDPSLAKRRTPLLPIAQVRTR